MTEETANANACCDENRSFSKAALFSLALALLIPTLGVSITNVALPELAARFHASVATVSWVVISYLASVTTFIIGAGVLGDIWGRKPLLLLGVGIFSFASLLCAISGNLWLLIAARLVQGFGAAFILSQTLALASVAFPKAKVGSAMGLLSTTAAIGTALGPVVGGALLHVFGWQSIFWLLFVMGGVSFTVCALFIPNEQLKFSATVKQYDVIGTLLLGLSCLLYALSVTAHSTKLSVSGTVLFMLAIAVFTVFLISQRKRRFPLINLAFFQHKLRNLTLAANFLVDAVAMSTLVVGPYYLTYGLGLSVMEIGMLMAVGPVVAACSGYPSGKLVDLIGVKRVMLLGLSQLIVGVVCFAWLPVQFGVYGYIAALFILTPARQLFLTSNHTFVMSSATNQEKGLASGILNLVKNLGLMTGASVMVALFASQLKDENIALATQQELGAAFTSTFLLAGAVIGVSLICIYLFSANNKEFK